MQELGKVIRPFCRHQNFVPKGLPATALELYKIIKNVYKIRFQSDHFETCNIWVKGKCLSVVMKILSPICCLPLPGAIYMWRNMIKTCIKSDFKDIVLKFATIGQSDKGFLLTSKFVPKGLSAPALGLYACIKTLKYIYQDQMSVEPLEDHWSSC